jgi:hypothetical protein
MLDEVISIRVRRHVDMKKSTVVKALGAILLSAVLLAAVGAVTTAQSYAECVSQIIRSAPPTDSRPPALYRDLSRVAWGHRDVFLARVLARECTSEGGGGLRRLGSQLFGLGVIKARLSLHDRQTLSSIFFLTPGGGRGLTRAAQEEWGRPPASLNESEMTWLFVVGQAPSCSKRVGSEADRQVCEQIYQSLLARLPRPTSSSSGGS